MEYGLIGEKLGHSYSKVIHEMIADYTYDIHPVAKNDFDTFMTNKPFKAINVTIPYKQDVIPYLDDIDDNAKSIGAVNTIVLENGRYIGHNTDYAGFMYMVKKYRVDVEGKKILVLGKGGASKAIIAVMNNLKAAEILTVYYRQAPDCITYEECINNHTDADIIINTTPVGMYPNCNDTPLDLTPFYRCQAVLDVIYNPIETVLVKQARTMGMISATGLDMLVAQAVYASEYFQNKKLCASNDEYTQLIDSISDKIAKELS